MKPTGTNTATIARVTASTARAISLAPASAASNGVAPASSFRTMFSITTTASSMRSPIERVRASIETRLKVNPRASIAAKVPITEVGRAMAAMIVERALRRKRSTTSTASNPPRTRASRTAPIDASMEVELSLTTASRTPSGSCPSNSATASLARFATSTVLAPDCFCTEKATADCPPQVAAERASAGPSITVATSATRTGTPPGLVTTSARTSSGVRTWVESRTVRSSPLSRVRPAGVSRFCRDSAPATSVTARPWARNRSGSTTTRISRSRPPIRSTWPRPACGCSCGLTTSSARRVSSCTGRSPERTEGAPHDQALFPAPWAASRSPLRPPA